LQPVFADLRTENGQTDGFAATALIDPSAPRPRRWQQELKNAIRDPSELCRFLDLPDRVADAAVRAAEDFPLFAPRPYVALIERGNPADPLLRQILPLADEENSPPGYVDDPVDDLTAARSPGLLHKYEGRVLLITTGACAVHCRYCFRRHFPYSETPRSVEQWGPAIEQIASDASIHEVILSGGDPLTLVDPILAELAERLARVPHLQRLRIHTRLPIMIPDRVTEELLAWLRGTRLTPIMVIHANHPAELQAGAAAALGRLADAGIPLLNQSVLLCGVNDDVEIQATLSERLVQLRVMPYYLHQLDRVRGAAHFETPIARGQELINSLRERLPGYAVPRYVNERPGQPSKTPLS
jgi:EF-P beta-lysylation protein EpmB